METRRDVFQAIADPTRRQMIDLLSIQPQNMNAIAANFEVSRQAISLHMKILEECGLVHIRQEGNNRFCQIRLEKLKEVNDWTVQHKVFWTNKLRALRNFLDDETRELNKRQIKTKKTKRK